MPSLPLLKILTMSGIGSRRRLADAIKQSRVAVNGEVVADFRYPVDTEKDRVAIDGRPVKLGVEQPVYLMLNKPRGVISTVRDERGRRTVIDCLPQKYRSLRLYPVGRLDKDSTGLLLLTNDGELTHKLTHPSFEHEKEYLVQISAKLKLSEKQRLERGVELEDGRTHPAVVREVPSLPPFSYSITIHEGRKRQVRRMFDSIGHPTLSLKRIRMGNLTLGDLGEGKTRELSIQEVRALLRGSKH
ncbi:MAG TPA: pseudouridine synthase [Dehalococcoidales bacterium]|nr:pseudouridine synthase [Dehalococcoidales bacterium]